MTRFQRIPGSPVFVPEAHSSRPEEARVFLLFTSDPQGAAFTLEESFAMPGSRYAFLPSLEPVSDWVELGRALLNRIQAQDSPRLSWFQSRSELIAGLLVAPAASDGSAVSASTSLRLRESMALRVAAGCPIAISEGSSFEVRPRGTLRIVLRAGATLADLDVLQTPLRLPTLGEDRGRFACEAALTAEDLGRFEAGLRYFETDQDPLNIQGFQIPLFFPVQGQTLRFRVVLDPLDNPTPRPGRTRFEFADSQVGIHMPTEAGHPGRLAPLAGARLALASNPSSFIGEGVGDNQNFYLVPEGEFEIRTAPQDGAVEAAAEAVPTSQGLILGTAGTEVARVSAGGGGDVLVFKPGQPAFFRRPGAGDSLEATAATPSPRDLLSSIGTTAWMAIRPSGARVTEAVADSGAAPGYFAQPEDAPLYTAAPDPGLQYERIELNSLGGEVFFPVLPPGGVERGQVETLRSREAEFISPLRRHEIVRSRPAVETIAADPTEVLKATTPQGLVGDLDRGDWKKLLLARTPRSGQPQDLVIDNASPELSDALQRSRVFIVCTDGRKLGTFSKQTTIAGWQFDLLAALQSGEPAQPGGKKQVLLFKFHDRPLEELIDDPRAWTRTDHFNPDTVSVRDFLKGFIAEARAAHAAAGASSPYGKFLEVVTSPAWNGILALNAAIDPAAMPEQVQCLLGGMKLERFLAHHVGIDMSRVSDAIDVQGSTLFGLIDYNDPTPPTGSDPDYKLHVPFLRVLFESSVVKAFDCTLRLTVNNLFDEKTELRSGSAPPGLGANTLEFKGRYESHKGRDVYTFIHEKRYDFDLRSSQFLRSVTVTKLQLSTVDSREEAGTQKVTSRFAFWGELAFQDLGSMVGFDLLSFNALGFSDLGLLTRFEIRGGSVSPATFEFDPGDLRLDVSVNQKRAKSLLESFAMKLKSFLYSKRGFRPRDLGGFPIRLPRINLPLPDCFRYGLAFEIDLGTLGGLVSGPASFKVDFLVGWGACPGSADNRLYVALKLPESSGGKKEIGLQGVLRLVIKDFAFITFEERGTTIYALKLEDCSLEILGKRLPPEGKANFHVFADPRDGVERAISTLGWFGTFEPQDPQGAFHLDFLGLGQRVAPGGGASLDTYERVEHFLREQLPDQFSAEALKGFYQPDRGWSLATRMELVDAFTLGAVFFDPFLYSLFVGVLPRPGGGHAFTVEINYRKVTEEIGVWAIDVGLPPSVRQMEFGAVSVSIPNLGLSIFTNGDFLIDIGFPRGLDFRRSFQAQALPFIGWGGFYFGKLSGATSLVLPGEFNTVVQVGLALRLGLGKEFRKGILSAGLSITFFGILEGAAAYRRLEAGNLQALAHPEAYSIEGRFGVIGEIFGVVDFGIVKAGVYVRIDAGIGVRLREIPGRPEPLVLWVDAGVSVRVEVVIGRIKTFFGTIEIKISFSFETRVRFDWKIDRGGAGTEAVALEPLAWSRLLWASQAEGLEAAVRAPLPLLFVPEVTVVDGEPQGIAMLAIERGESAPGPFDRLVRALAEWALRTHLGLPDDGSDAPVTVEHLESLDARLNTPRTLDGPANGAEALDYEKLKTFLSTRFQVTVQLPPPASSGARPMDAVYFPMIPDLLLSSNGRPGGDLAVDFRAFTPCGGAYRDAIDQFFQDLWVNLDKRERGIQEATADLTAGPSMATLVFQDYFGFLIKGAVDRLWRRRLEIAGEATLLSLLDDVPVYKDLGGMATRFFRHGLRLPEAAGAARTDALYRLLGQQFPLMAGAAAPASFAVRLEKPAAADWFELDGGGPVSIQLEGQTIQDLRGRRMGAPDPAQITRVPPVIDRPAAFSFQVKTPWASSGGGLMLWSFPEALSKAIAGRDPQTLDVRLKTGPLGQRFAPDSQVVEVPAADFQAATRVELAVTRPAPAPGGAAPAAEPGPVYVLSGMGEADRRLLDALTALGALPARTSLSLAYAAATGEGLVEHPADSARVFLVQTNLSTETNPGELPVALEAVPPARFHASLAEPGAFGRLVWQSSLVNSGGYYLFTGEPLPERLFQAGQAARVTLIFRFPEGVTFRSCHNALAVKPAVADSDLLFAETEQLREPQRTLEPGCVAFELNRPHPARTLRVPPGIPHPGGPGTRLTFDELKALLEANGLRPDTPDWLRRLAEAGVYESEIDNLYNLLDYAVAADSVFTASKDCLPVGPETVAPEVWRYRQTVPVHNFALAPGQPPNRYATVGRRAGLRFAWRDVFGNLAPASGPVELPHLYFDRLVRVSEWPGVVLAYDVRGTNGLAVTLTFDPRVYREHHSDPKLVELDLAVYERVREQLGGPGAAIHFRTSLDGRRLHPLSPCGSASPLSLDSFLTGVQEVLARIKVGEPTGDTPLVFMSCHTVDRSAAPVDTFRELEVELVVSREEGLLDPVVRQALQADPEGLYREIQRTVAPVPPPFVGAQGGAPANSALEAFATRFETAFAGLRLATGLGSAGAQSLWVVADAVLAVEAGGGAVTFAPRPLSLELWSGQTAVHDYTPDREDADGLLFVETRAVVVDVDLDRHARSFLEAVEDLLAPEPAVAIRRVEPGVVESLMLTKERLADRLSGQVATVLQGQSVEGTGPARESYRQKLRLSLRQAYGLDAVVHLPLRNLPVSAERARLYGRMIDRRTAGNPGAATFQLSVARVALPQQAGETPALTFVVDSFQEEAQSTLTLDLAFEVTYVEHGIQTRDQGEDRFETSNWLKLVFPRVRALGERTIPIVLREYPQPPVLLGHRFQPEPLAPEAPGALRMARSWRYGFEYQWPGAAQDSLVAEVEYNHFPEAGREALAVGDGVPESLVRFQLEAAHLKGVLAGLPEAARIAGAATPPPPASPEAKRLLRVRQALARVAELSGQVADAFDLALLEAASAGVSPRDLFRVVERGASPSPREIEIRPDPEEPRTRPMEQVEISPKTFGGETLPFQAVEVSPQVRRIRFQEPAAQWRRREILVHGNDVLQVENAWAGIHLERNAGLLPGTATSRSFVFKTSSVKFGQPLTPALDRPEILAIHRLGGGTAQPPQRTLREHLEGLFAELFRETSAVRRLRVECRYGFDIRGTFGSPGELTATVPIRLFPDLSSDGPLAELIAAALREWASREKPNRAGFFSLDVAVFNSQAGSPVPLLRLRRLVLSLGSISDLP